MGSTGAKNSFLDYGCGSRFSGTHTIYFALSDLPSEFYFIVDIVIVGSAGPIVFLNTFYSSSLIISHVANISSPLYSSLYELSQVFFSLGCSDIYCRRVEGSREIRLSPDTLRALMRLQTTLDAARK